MDRSETSAPARVTIFRAVRVAIPARLLTAYSARPFGETGLKPRSAQGIAPIAKELALTRIYTQGKRPFPLTGKAFDSRIYTRSVERPDGRGDAGRFAVVALPAAFLSVPPALVPNTA
jgi:hypothetical protein